MPCRVTKYVEEDRLQELFGELAGCLALEPERIYATKQTGGAIFCNGMKWMRRKAQQASAMRSCVIALAF